MSGKVFFCCFIWLPLLICHSFQHIRCVGTASGIDEGVTVIVTVTLNPSIDRTAGLSGPLNRGRVNRLGSCDEVAAGKGVNISRVLHGAGADTCAIVPAHCEDPLVIGLQNDDIPHLAVPIRAATRTNLTLTEPGRRSTSRGPTSPPMNLPPSNRPSSRRLTKPPGWCCRDRCRQVFLQRGTPR